jgi:hypothetical protein
VKSFVLTLLSAAAGAIRRGAAARCEVSSNEATAPSAPIKAKGVKVPAPVPVKAKKVKTKAKRAKVPAAVPAKTAEQDDSAVPTVPMKALKRCALALSKVCGAFGSVMEIVFTIVPIVDVLVMAAVALAKASDAFEFVLKSVVDPVMEVVFTIVPVFDVLAEVLKLSFSVLSKVCNACDSAMEVVFTIVPIFDVLFAAIQIAFKLAVLLVVALCKAVKAGLHAMAAAAVAFLKELFAPVLKAFAVLKFVFYTFPRWVWAQIR